MQREDSRLLGQSGPDAPGRVEASPVVARRLESDAMRSACLIAAGVFALFSYWQFNDLEEFGTRLWYGWALLYGATSGVSLFSARRLLPPAAYLSAAALAGLAAVWRSSEIAWQAGLLDNPTNPAGNETGGLLVVGLWLGFLAWRSRLGQPSAHLPAD